jgi:hypothetical protein
MNDLLKETGNAGNACMEKANGAELLMDLQETFYCKPLSEFPETVLQGCKPLSADSEAIYMLLNISNNIILYTQ